MSIYQYQYVYGPVPSRRLGRSLGIDLVKHKTCSYDCVYCQLGRTTQKTIERKEYVPIQTVLSELKHKLDEGTSADYISLAGSGEPTLNSGIEDLIVGIKEMTSIPLTVLTNGSLLWINKVQESLMAADIVLPSLDAGNEQMFLHINRPHPDISFIRMINGLRDFTKAFPGEVWLEVLLMAGLTGLSAEVKKISSIVQKIAPQRVQLNTVTRPPAMEFALPLDNGQMETLAEYFHGNVDIISEVSVNELESQPVNGPADEDFLALISRRPCTYEDVSIGLHIHVAESLKRLNALATLGKIEMVHQHGHNYYMKAGADGS